MQALLSAVKSSFSGLKRRLASTAVGGALFLERPVFGVDLQLRVPAVVLHPSLEEIQEAINATAKKVGRRRGGRCEAARGRTGSRQQAAVHNAASLVEGCAPSRE